MLVVGEDGGGELGTGYKDFGHEAKALTNEDGGGDERVAGGCPIVRVGPFGDGDGDGAAFEDVIVDIAAFPHEAAFTDLAGKLLHGAGDEQEFGVDRHLRTGAVVGGSVLDEHGLFVDIGADSIPTGAGEGGGAEVGVPAGGGDGSSVEERAGIRHGGTDARIGGEDGRDQAGNVAHASGGQLAGVGAQFAGFIAVDKLEGEGDVAAVFGEAGSFGAITDGEFGVGAAFGNGG